MGKIKLILILMLALYGFYIMGRNLLSGDIFKILYVIIGIGLLSFIGFIQGKRQKKRNLKENIEYAIKIRQKLRYQ